MEIIFIVLCIFVLIWLFSVAFSDDSKSNSNSSSNFPANSNHNKVPYVDQVKQKEAEERARQQKQAAWEEQRKQIAAQTKRLQEEALAKHQREERERAEQRRQNELRAEQQRQARAEQQRREAARAELDLHERETQYARLVECAFNQNPYGFSLSMIRSFSKNTGVFEQLQSGVAQLSTDEQLQQYIFAYGNMHRGKLNQAFESLVDNHDFDLNGEAIEIIDYGCGQGIGTVGFVDFLKSYPNFDYEVRRVRLIEPSRMALARAALHVRYSLRSVDQQPLIHSIQKELDDITTNNLECDDDTVKFHIFSNILDMEEFDLDDLCRKISNTFTGRNYFICVSPNFRPNSAYTHTRNSRLVEFMEYFDNLHDTTEISARSSNIGSWTRFERVFVVDFDDVAAAVDDEPDDLPFPTNNRRATAAPSFYNDEPDDLPF